MFELMVVGVISIIVFSGAFIAEALERRDRKANPEKYAEEARIKAEADAKYAEELRIKAEAKARKDDFTFTSKLFVVVVSLAIIVAFASLLVGVFGPIVGIIAFLIIMLR